MQPAHLHLMVLLPYVISEMFLRILFETHAKSLVQRYSSAVLPCHFSNDNALQLLLQFSD